MDAAFGFSAGERRVELRKRFLSARRAIAVADPLADLFSIRQQAPAMTVPILLANTALNKHYRHPKLAFHPVQFQGA